MIGENMLDLIERKGNRGRARRNRKRRRGKREEERGKRKV